MLQFRTHFLFLFSLCFALAACDLGGQSEVTNDDESMAGGGGGGDEGGSAGTASGQAGASQGASGGAMGGQTDSGGAGGSGGQASGGNGKVSAGGMGGMVPPEGSVPMFVAIGRGGRRIMSCDRGRTWIANQFVSTVDGEHSTFTPKGLAYGNGTFVFLSGWGNPSTTWVTRNGIDWLEQKHQTGFAGIGFDDGQFVLVGGNYHEGSKDNGTTWSRLTPPKANLGRDAAAFTGIWAAGSDGQAQVLRKGTNAWTPISGCTGQRHGGIGADGGFAANSETMISVGDGGDVCGVNIVTGAGIAPSKFSVKVSGKPTFAAGSFIVATGDSIRFSKDGSNWTSKALPKPIDIDLVDCDASGTCVGISLDGKSFYYSDDATTWIKATAPAGNGMVAVKAGAGLPSKDCKLP